MTLLSLAIVIYFIGILVTLYEGMQHGVVEEAVEASDNLGVENKQDFPLLVAYAYFSVTWPYTLIMQTKKYIQGEESLLTKF